MRILLVNKFHYRKGGAERAYFDTARVLEERGHEVAFFSMEDPRNEPTLWSEYFVSGVEYEGGEKMPFLKKLRAARNILWNFEAARNMDRLVSVFRPDIVHLHNIYHQISPSIIPVLNRRGIPIVMTLHDYKIVSPNYSLYVQGKIWEETSPVKTVLDRAVKDSFTKSLVCAGEAILHRLLKVYRGVDAFISPSHFLISEFKKLGFTSPIEQVPQPVDLAAPFVSESEEQPHELLFFGRLSKEKGVITLLEAFSKLPTRYQLTIVGDGPEKERLIQRAAELNLAPRINFMGAKYGQDLETVKRRAGAIVLPSEWYENMPYVLLESLALGKIVVAANIGGVPERIIDQKTGILFAPGDAEDLALKIRSMEHMDREAMKRVAYESVRGLDFYSYGERLESLYARLVDKAPEA